MQENNTWHPNIWPPFTQVTLSSPPQKIYSAKDSLLFLDEEKESSLIDAISSWWVTLHGHSNEYIAKAIGEQASKLEQVIFADFIHPQSIKLSERLSKLTGLERLFFSDNGSTAVEVALKIGYQWWRNMGEPRTQIIAFDGAYHGDTFGAMAVGERNIFNSHFEEIMFPVKRVAWPSTWRGDNNVNKKEEYSLDQLATLLKIPTALVIFEPLVQGAGGMSMVRPEFLRKCQELIKENGSLLIADEVLTGFGRCGSFLASEQSGLKPDLISLSKGLTGGFLPMGITMASEKIYQSFLGSDPKNTFWHGHSFTANPLGCAAANASLDLLQMQMKNIKNFHHRHNKFMQIIENHSKVEHIRIRGTIAAFKLKGKEQSGYLNQNGKRLKHFAINNGVFLRPLGDIVYLMPPLCISDDQLDFCYQIIEKGLNQI
tara:strand:- start:4970 stop:6256 length:1287 start_codon:yes stop_codon:yes gene_type:complete